MSGLAILIDVMNVVPVPGPGGKGSLEGGGRNTSWKILELGEPGPTGENAIPISERVP
jgi:hypothetical protein